MRTPTIALWALVAISATQATGCAAPGAIAPGAAQADVDAQANIALLSRQLQQTTTQKASTEHAGDQQAGGNLVNNQVAPNVSGSGWPAVAVTALFLAIGAALLLGLAWLYLRVRYGQLRRSSLAVAKSITAMPADGERPRLLGLIDSKLTDGSPDRRAWDKLLKQHRLYVTREPGGQHAGA